MKTVYDAIIAARNTSSKNEKIAILTAAKSDDLKNFLSVVYEPRINFFQSKVDTKTHNPDDDSGVSPTFDADFLSEVVATLNGRRLTGNAAKRWLTAQWHNLRSDWERELLEMLIARDVKAGFSGNTVNKVFGAGTVTDVPYMRCSLPKDAKLSGFSWKDGVFSQIKADGMFAAINVEEDGTIAITSRNGSPFPVDVEAFRSLKVELVNLVPMGVQVHGELLVEKDGELLPRQESNGHLNTLLKSGEIDTGLRVIFDCWDAIPIVEAKAKNKYKVPYQRRFHNLQNWIGAYKTVSLRLIETKMVFSLGQAYAHYASALERGLEGTIVKNPSMIWEDTTSKFQVKLKLEFEVDLEVYDYEEGKGKAAGTLGALRCRTSDGKLEVKVGSGFTDAMRKDIWDLRDLRIITVKSNSIMPPTRKETYSLFLPIFVEQRLDKTEADSLERVQDQYNSAIKSVGDLD